MADDFIFAEKKSKFSSELNSGLVADKTVAFIEDTKEIWNHGVYFDGKPFNPDNVIDMGLNVLAVDADDSYDDIDSYIYKDLSKFNIYGKPINLTTANCYVVQEKGTYKIPVVYGNSIKDGAVNTAAYTKVEGTYSHAFVNYKGVLITSPYIETDTKTTITSALLTIADENNIFTNIKITSGDTCKYIKFKVESVPATGANGVISVLDSNGTIMWSWHIWVWPDDLSPVTIINHTGVKYDILPVNLGSKWETNGSNPTLIKNWYYLFGRPTPLLLSKTYNSGTNASSYGALNYTIAECADTYELGITNPTTFYKYLSEETYNWFGEASYYNLWDASCVSTGASDNNTVKTIYDPCPIGFKVGNGRVFTGFTTTGINTSDTSLFNIVGSFNNGYYFKRYAGDTVGIFFPTSGSRSFSSGLLGDVGACGHVWSSSSNLLATTCFLSFSSSGVDPLGGSYRATGRSVRPVAEL